MSNVGPEITESDLFNQFSLPDTISEQRTYSRALQAQPLKDVFDSLKQRTGVDLLTIRERNYDGEAKDKPPADLEIFFDPQAKNRKYYSYEWWDKRDKLTRKYLTVEEEQVANNPDLSVLAVFDAIPWKATFNSRKAPYLYLERLYLINKQINKAVELASPWWQLPLDKDDPLVRSKERRIGFFPRSENITGEDYESIAKTNSMIVTDTQEDKPWFFSLAVGEGKTPALPKWLAYGLAGAEATQKERDIKLPQGIIGKLLKTSMSKSQVALANKLIDPWRDDSLRFSLRDLKTRIAETGLPPEIVERLVGKVVSAEQAMVGREIFEKAAVLALIRLKRNALAVTFRFLDHLKWQGFDLTGLSKDELTKERKRILEFYDNLYKKHLEELGVKATFSSGTKASSVSSPR